MMKFAMTLFAASATICSSASVLAQQVSAPARVAGDAGNRDNGPPLGQLRPMTAQLAKQLVATAIKASCAQGGACSGAFAVTDDAGVVIYLETIDGVLAGGPDLAIRKAKASALWRRPTQTFLDAVNKGSNTSYADGTFTDMTTSPGGIPIVKDGRVVGGFGQAAVGSRAAVQRVSDAVAAEATRLFGKQ